MRALSADELLGVWEAGQGQHPVERALTLLGAACPGIPRSTLARLSVGRRDGCLLALREWSFGRRLASVESCPACGERVEVSFDVDDIRAAPALPPDQTAEAEAPSLTLQHGEYEVQIRPPNSLDLLAAGAVAPDDVEGARRLLVERCVVGAWLGGAATEVTTLPDAVVEAAVTRLESADPQANVELVLDCPACRERWLSVFDVAAYFWAEIEAWAPRLLQDVHVLASTYGWAETDILALSPLRRHYYLELARG